MTNDPVVNAPIRGLQQMLRTLSFYDERIPRIIPDGIYGSSTSNAVNAFQKAYQLPVTGTSDENTFAAIVRAYNRALEALTVAEAAVMRFPVKLEILPGQYHPHVALAQAMLSALHAEYPEIPVVSVTSILDPVTSEALKQIQKMSGLPETGTLNLFTWNRLARLYRANFDRNLLPSQG